MLSSSSSGLKSRVSSCEKVLAFSVVMECQVQSASTLGCDTYVLEL